MHAAGYVLLATCDVAILCIRVFFPALKLEGEFGETRLTVVSPEDPALIVAITKTVIDRGSAALPRPHALDVSAAGFGRATPHASPR